MSDGPARRKNPPPPPSPQDALVRITAALESCARDLTGIRKALEGSGTAPAPGLIGVVGQVLESLGLGRPPR